MASPGSRGQNDSDPVPPPDRPGDGAAQDPAASPTAFELTDETVERALQTGEYVGLLEDYFGPELYQELQRTAREAAVRSVRGGPRVLILPGIMGSKIGTKGLLPFLDDVCWVDPIDIANGRLAELALPVPGGGREFRAVGTILLAYLKLKLRLRANGFDADFHPFDWRQDIAVLGRELAERIGRERRKHDKVSLVAHSMGGLVARWALGAGQAECERLIMLGTPNFGSFAPVMALRATYPVVRKIGWLDVRHTPEELARDVFAGFPGLTQMLPAPERFAEVDLYDVDAWPADGLRPRAEILDAVAATRAGLAPGADDMVLIAGVNRETVTGLRRGEDGEFLYEMSTAGDGTVPLDFALLPGARTHYVDEAHGSLANNGLVAMAVMELLGRGETAVLPTTPPARARAVRTVPEAELRVDPYEGRRGRMLSQREMRLLVEEVASPESQEAAPVAGEPVLAGAGAHTGDGSEGYRHRFEGVVVARRRQHRIELRLAHGSITEVDSRAIALGIFQGVTPSGAAAALDRRLGGAINEFTRRRMFNGAVGEVFAMPTGRHALTADLIAFVGLGPFDRFTDDVLQVAAENIIRTFASTRVEEFATVVFSGGSTRDGIARGLRNLLTGFFRGLRDADRDHRFRRILVCEQDDERFLQLKEEMYRLSSTALCDDIEITFDEIELPPPLEAPAPRLAAPARQPVYLLLRREASVDGREWDVRSSLLTAGGKAMVVTGVTRVPVVELDRVRKAIVNQSGHDFGNVGARLGELLLAPQVREVLPRYRDRHLVVVHDAEMSAVPWETLAFPAGDGDRWHPALVEGISHRYAADNLSVAKWLEERVEDSVLNLLLVVDPTADLPGAEAEGERVLELFRDRPACRIERLYQSEATHMALRSAFSSGRYDVVHYAGHAFFDEHNPARSGLLCYNGVPLTGAELAGLGNLPTLVFFNACESGRVRNGRRARPTIGARLERVQNAVGLAEAFMRGGVANFLGTYWPVGDAPAKAFATEFYSELLLGQTIGAALGEGRRALSRMRSRDWADYIFYGDPDFVLKEIGAGAGPRGRVGRAEARALAPAG